MNQYEPHLTTNDDCKTTCDPQLHCGSSHVAMGVVLASEETGDGSAFPASLMVSRWFSNPPWLIRRVLQASAGYSSNFRMSTVGKFWKRLRGSTSSCQRSRQLLPSHLESPGSPKDQSSCCVAWPLAQMDC